MQGDCRHRVLEDQNYLGDARTEPRYRMVDCGSYPGLLDADPGGVIEGEVYAVDATCLAWLDQVEGVPEGLYARRRIALEPPFDASPVEAYFFLGDVRGMPDCDRRWHGRSRTLNWNGDPPEPRPESPTR